MEAWYLVYSKPRQEKVAFANLTRQGYMVYFPRIRHSGSNEKEGSIQPTFPRYLFIRLNDRTDNWGYVRSTKGVCHLVRFGDTPACVPDSLIATLRGLENEQGIRELYEPAFQPGDHVRIAHGALKGYEAIFQANTGHERVHLLLDTAGTRARVEIDESQISLST
jgi:transcriptional antiterminator RfaH